MPASPSRFLQTTCSDEPDGSRTEKTGQLSVTRDQLVAWIDFVNGKIVRARSSEVDGTARDIVLKVLDWKHGYFELTSGQPSPGNVELDVSVTHLLLEHARLSDEAARADVPTAAVDEI